MTGRRRHRLGRRFSTLGLTAVVLAGCGVGVQSHPEPLSRQQLDDAGGPPSPTVPASAATDRPL